MIINVTLTDDEKKTLTDTLHILMTYKNYQKNGDYMDTLTLINSFSEFIDKTCIN